MTDILCHYEPVPSSANFNLGFTAFQLRGGKVTGVAVASAYSYDQSRNLVADISRALAKYKTAGIGLGATIAQLKRASRPSEAESPPAASPATLVHQYPDLSIYGSARCLPAERRAA